MAPIVWLHPSQVKFPDPEKAPADGLLAAGGDLSPERLLAAYRQGIFPWYGDNSPILWHSPDPRGVLPLSDLHVPRRLARTLRRFDYTHNADFVGVIQTCAAVHQFRAKSTWITEDMVDAYIDLHDLGHAHSVEVWEGDTLVGGIYGVAMGGVFCGESMFHLQRDASKCAFFTLCRWLGEAGFQLLDTQMPNPHLLTLGVVEMRRAEFLARLGELRDLRTKWTPPA